MIRDKFSDIENKNLSLPTGSLAKSNTSKGSYGSMVKLLNARSASLSSYDLWGSYDFHESSHVGSKEFTKIVPHGRILCLWDGQGDAVSDQPAFLPKESDCGLWLVALSWAIGVSLNGGSFQWKYFTWMPSGTQEWNRLLLQSPVKDVKTHLGLSKMWQTCFCLIASRHVSRRWKSVPFPFRTRWHRKRESERERTATCQTNHQAANLRLKFSWVLPWQAPLWRSKPQAVMIFCMSSY